jgi:hypothetical protein
MHRLPEAFLVATLMTGAAGCLRAQTPGLLGRWVGESKCIGSQPACHDEHVIYQVDSAGPRHFTLKGSRTAGTDTVDMGDLSCESAAGDSGISCRIPQGVWRFSVVQGRLEGVLTQSNGTVTRRAVADRAQP